jgi:hypothetical protein
MNHQMSAACYEAGVLLLVCYFQNCCGADLYDSSECWASSVCCVLPKDVDRLKAVCVDTVSTTV